MPSPPPVQVVEEPVLPVDPVLPVEPVEPDDPVVEEPQPALMAAVVMMTAENSSEERMRAPLRRECFVMDWKCGAFIEYLPGAVKSISKRKIGRGRVATDYDENKKRRSIFSKTWDRGSRRTLFEIRCILCEPDKVLLRALN